MTNKELLQLKEKCDRELRERESKRLDAYFEQLMAWNGGDLQKASEMLKAMQEKVAQLRNEQLYAGMDKLSRRVMEQSSRLNRQHQSI